MEKDIISVGERMTKLRISQKLVYALIIIVILSFPIQGQQKSSVESQQHPMLQPKIVIVVDDITYEKYRYYIDRYALETYYLLRADNYSVILKIINASWTASMLRQYLKSEYEEGATAPVSTPIRKMGAILIGNIPYIRYAPEDSFDEEIGGRVCNEYYTHLYYEFKVDEHGYVHNRPLGIPPTIWISVIKPPDESADLSRYFEKVHEYRYGLISLPRRVYVEYSIDFYGKFANETFVTESLVSQFKPLLRIYPSIVLVPWTTAYPLPSGSPYSILLTSEGATKIPWNTTSNYEEFVNALTAGYEVVFLRTHGFVYSNIMDKVLWYNDIKRIKPGAFLYALTSCYNGEWHVKNYIAGWYIFGDGYGIVSLQSYSGIGVKLVLAGMSSFIGDAFLTHWSNDIKIFGDPIFPLRFYNISLTLYPNILFRIDGDQWFKTDQYGRAKILISSYGDHVLDIPSMGEHWIIRVTSSGVEIVKTVTVTKTTTAVKTATTTVPTTTTVISSTTIPTTIVSSTIIVSTKTIPTTITSSTTIERTVTETSIETTTVRTTTTAFTTVTTTTPTTTKVTETNWTIVGIVAVVLLLIGIGIRYIIKKK